MLVTSALLSIGAKLSGAMMNIDFDDTNLGVYATDPIIEAETGIVYDFAGRKIRLLRAGGSNKAFQRVLQKKLLPYRPQLNRGEDLPTEVLDQIFKETYSETVVIDWDVMSSTGAPVDCIPENVLAFFERFPEIWQDMRIIASNRASFQEDFVKSLAREAGKS